MEVENDTQISEFLLRFSEDPELQFQMYGIFLSM
jgi:hypothetical protein